MSKRTPVVVSDEGNFVAKSEGDIIDVAISAKDGNTIVQESDGLYAASGDGGSQFVAIYPAYDPVVPAEATSTASIAIGEGAVCSGNQAIALGARAKCDGDRGITIGGESYNGAGGIVIGSTINTTWNNIIIGKGGSTTSGSNVLVGDQTVGAHKVVAIGTQANSRSDEGVAVGNVASVWGEGGVAIGARAGVNPDHKNSVAIGLGSLTSRSRAVSFGASSLLRTLEYVNAGTEPTDAVNVGQLNKALQNFTPAISSVAGNTIVAKTDGLYAPNATKLVKAGTSGNISWNYQDTPTADDAAGKLGTGCYLKFSVNFYAIKAGVTDFIPEVTLTRAPCDENGNIIPHQLYISSVKASNNTTPKVKATLLMERIPTHTIEIETLKITPVARADEGLPVGIPEIPVAEGGRVEGNELTYRAAAMVKSTDLV